MSSQQMHHAFSLVENKTEKLSYLVYQKKPRSVSIYNFGIYIHLLSFKKKKKPNSFFKIIYRLLRGIFSGTYTC